MCGRFAMDLDPHMVQTKLESHGFKIEKIEGPEKVHPGLNKAPQSFSMIYCQSKNSDKTELVAMKWSLQPYWTKEPLKYPTFNTRCESLKPLKTTWRSATHRRGILAMQGYYEWDQDEHLPYYIHGHDLLYCLIIWDSNPQLGDSPTFSIVTEPASPRLKKIHERMPVIVATRAEAELWTQGSWPGVLDLIEPNDGLDYHRVAKDVNKVGIEKPGLNSPLKESRIKTILDFFPKKRKTNED